MTNEERAYLAGILDGEGYVGIRIHNQNRRSITPVASVTNTNLPLLVWLKERWGGAIHLKQDKRPTSKAAWIWIVASRDVESVLRDAYPYLIVKRPQADLVLSLPQRTPGTIRLTDEIVAKNREAIVLIHKLNKRGPAAA